VDVLSAMLAPGTGSSAAQASAWGSALKAHNCTRKKRGKGHGWQGITHAPFPDVTPESENLLTRAGEAEGYGISGNNGERGTLPLDPDLELAHVTAKLPGLAANPTGGTP
jgi:hypothetical protein